MARLVQGLRCVASQNFMVTRVAVPRNIFQHRCMHHGLSSTGSITPSLVKTVQVISLNSIRILFGISEMIIHPIEFRKMNVDIMYR